METKTQSAEENFKICSNGNCNKCEYEKVPAKYRDAVREVLGV